MITNSSWQRNTTLFLASQSISLFGSMLVQYAIMWFITLETQSGVMMTISIICGFLPTFFISPFAGVWADRYDRKRLIILADSMIAIATLVLAVLFLLGYDAIWWLFVASAIRAVGAGIQTPTVGAFLPQLVPADKLTKVNATFGSIQSLVTLVCPLLSGALLSLATIESIFFIDVATGAAAVLILLLFLRVPAHAKALDKQAISYFADMRLGLEYIAHHAFVMTLFVFCAIFFLLVAPLALLTPLQVARSFGDDVWRLSALEITFSVGMMLGGALMAYWGGFANKLHSLVLSNVVIAFATFALGIVPDFWVYLALMAVVGLALPVFNTPFTVLLQQKVEEGFLGRVFGVMSMIWSSMMPLGMLVWGPLSDFVAIEWLLIVTSPLILILSLFMLGNKALLEAGRPLSEDGAIRETSAVAASLAPPAEG
ncbi:MAG: MFS transporter [Chloroflexota bacterium]